MGRLTGFSSQWADHTLSWVSSRLQGIHWAWPLTSQNNFKIHESGKTSKHLKGKTVNPKKVLAFLSFQQQLWSKTTPNHICLRVKTLKPRTLHIKCFTIRTNESHIANVAPKFFRSLIMIIEMTSLTTIQHEIMHFIQILQSYAAY